VERQDRLMTERIVFFGTPEFAVPSLEALHRAGHSPRLVISQPARPAGRGRALHEPEVAVRARELGLAVAQPMRLVELRGALEADPPTVIVVVAYGRIFPDWLLALPERGCVNLHASLLPRWRGAAPIQAAVAAGDPGSGVTTMLMEAALDTGPILLRAETAIGPRETAPELARRLARLGGDLLVETLRRLAAGDLVATPQPTDGVTYAPRIRREDGLVDWQRSAVELYSRFRAFAGWPGLTASLAGQPLKITDCRPIPGADAGSAEPGEVVEVGARGLGVACGSGTLLTIGRMQRPGRKELPAEVFLRGETVRLGDRFDPPHPGGAG
jgi:methionyl-tRNA formyltransferase